MSSRIVFLGWSTDCVLAEENAPSGAPSRGEGRLGALGETADADQATEAEGHQAEAAAGFRRGAAGRRAGENDIAAGIHGVGTFVSGGSALLKEYVESYATEAKPVDAGTVRAKGGGSIRGVVGVIAVKITGAFRNTVRAVEGEAVAQAGNGAVRTIGARRGSGVLDIAASRIFGALAEARETRTGSAISGLCLRHVGMVGRGNAGATGVAKNAPLKVGVGVPVGAVKGAQVVADSGAAGQAARAGGRAEVNHVNRGGVGIAGLGVFNGEDQVAVGESIGALGVCGLGNRKPGHCGQEGDPFGGQFHALLGSSLF